MLCLHGHCMLELWARYWADFLSKIGFSLYLVQRDFYFFLRPEASTVIKYDNVFKLTITWRYFSWINSSAFIFHSCVGKQGSSIILTCFLFFLTLFYGNPSSRVTVMHLNWDTIWSSLLCWKGNIKMTEAVRQSAVWTSSSSLVLKSFVQASHKYDRRWFYGLKNEERIM